MGKNLEFWKNIAGCSDNMAIIGDPDDIYQRHCRARALFQDGIVCLLSEKASEGIKLLELSYDDYSDTMKECGKSEDYTRYYILSNILHDKNKLDVIGRAIELLMDDIYRDVMKFGVKDIFKIYTKAFTRHPVSEEAIRAAWNFEKTSHDKFAYKNVADSILRLSRLYLICNDIKQATFFSSIALELYKRAEEEIKSELLSVNTNWEIFLNEPDEAIMQSFPDEGAKFIEYRNMLRSNIPAMRSQIAMIHEVCSLIDMNRGIGSGVNLVSFIDPGFKGTSDFKFSVYEKLSNFIKEEITFYTKDDPQLSLLDQLEWVAIAHNFFRVLTGMNRTFKDIMMECIA